MEWYIKNADYLNESSFFLDPLRDIGGGIMKWLHWIATSAEKLFLDTYELLNFTQNKAFKEFIGGFKGVAVAIIILSLIGVGIILMVNHEKRPNLWHSMLLYAIVILLVPTFITKLNNIVISGANGVLSSSTGTTADSIINANFIDLLYVDQKNELTNLDIHYAQFNKDKLQRMKFSDTVNKDTEGISAEAKEKFNNHLVVDNSGNVDIAEFKDKGWLNIFNPPWYYRYDVNFTFIFIQLVALALAFICASYRVARLIYEIVMIQGVGTLQASNIAAPQKTVKMLQIGRDSYITLFLIACFIKIYALMINYLTSTSFSGFSKAIFSLFFAFAVIDGPYVVQQILGIDAGLTSGFTKVAATYAAVRSGARLTDLALFGNPLRGTKGLLNNNLAMALRGRGKEALNAGAAGISGAAGMTVGGVAGAFGSDAQSNSGAGGAGDLGADKKNQQTNEGAGALGSDGENQQRAGAFGLDSEGKQGAVGAGDLGEDKKNQQTNEGVGALGLDGENQQRAGDKKQGSADDKFYWEKDGSYNAKDDSGKHEDMEAGGKQPQRVDEGTSPKLGLDPDSSANHDMGQKGAMNRGFVAEQKANEIDSSLGGGESPQKNDKRDFSYDRVTDVMKDQFKSSEELGSRFKDAKKPIRSGFRAGFRQARYSDEDKKNTRKKDKVIDE